MISTSSITFGLTPHWLALTALAVSVSANASISLDRTRVIYPEKEKAVSLTLRNSDPKAPILAQAWIEDEHGQPVSSPFIALPPLQRIEPQEQTVVNITPTPGAPLPTDKESLFYLNVQEIPQKTDQTNSIQIAIRTKIKLFYRPTALKANISEDPARLLQISVDPTAHKLTLHNPSPYHISVATLAFNNTKHPVPESESLMLAPKADHSLPLPNTTFTGITIKHINDYGGQNTVSFQCKQAHCTVQEEDSK